MASNKINLSSLPVDELAKIKRDMEIKAARLAAAVDVRSQQVNAPTGAAKYLKNLYIKFILNLRSISYAP